MWLTFMRNKAKVSYLRKTGQGQMQNNTAVCSCRDSFVIVKSITVCVKIINRESVE